MTTLSLGPSPARRDALARRIRLLVAVTIAYNVIEAAVALTAGTMASSSALIGFGLDSVIEVSSAAAVAWQFSAREHAVRESRERTALRIISVSFFALAAYVAVDAVRTLAGTGEAEPSPSASSSQRSRWRSCRSCRPPSGALDARSGPPPPSPTPSRPCCARTCRPSCWSDCSSTPRSAGPGPIRSRPSPSLGLAVKEGARPGRARAAAPRRPMVKPAQIHPISNTSIARPQESHLRAAPLCGRISGAFGAFS